jgi:hypothetical protein
MRLRASHSGMNLKKFIAASLFVTLLVLFLNNDGVIADEQPEVIKQINPTQVVEKKQVSAYDSLNHQQQVWINALEWCESKGNKGAINPNDVDNTPSYYSFQFKPSTFKYYGEKYGVIESDLSSSVIGELIKDHFLQREIVAGMLNDKSVVMRKQFPMCVKSLGLPKATVVASKKINNTEVTVNSSSKTNI